QEQDAGDIDVAFPTVVEDHVRRQYVGGGRDRQALKVLPFDVRDLDIETRKPQSAANKKQKGSCPADLFEVIEGPGIGENRGRQPKTSEIAERVVFNAEVAVGAGQSRDAPVEGIEDTGEHDHPRGHEMVALDGMNDGDEAAKQGGGRDHIGEKINPLADTDSFDSHHTHEISYNCPSTISASGLAPAATFCPGSTKTFHWGGTQTSIREPKRIMP